MPSLLDAHDDLSKARKRLSMIDMALMHYLREVSIDKDPIEGIVYEIEELYSLLDSATEAVDVASSQASDLKDTLQERSEKLSWVADRKDQWKMTALRRKGLLNELYSIVEGRKNGDFETGEQACSVAAEVILERQPDAEFLMEFDLLLEVFDRAKDVVDAEMPVDTMDELKDAVRRAEETLGEEDTS